MKKLSLVLLLLLLSFSPANPRVDGLFDDLDCEGNVQVDGTLNTDGAVTFNSTLDVDGGVTFNASAVAHFVVKSPTTTFPTAEFQGAASGAPGNALSIWSTPSEGDVFIVDWNGKITSPGDLPIIIDKMYEVDEPEDWNAPLVIINDTSTAQACDRIIEFWEDDGTEDLMSYVKNSGDHCLNSPAGNCAAYLKTANAWVTAQNFPDNTTIDSQEPCRKNDVNCDTAYMETDTAGQINALAVKGTPVGADVLVIEDSAASWAKKKAAISTIATSEVNDLEADDPPNVLDDEVYVGTGAGTGAWAALQNCNDTTEKLDFNGTAFSCVTDSDTSGIDDIVEDTTPQLGGDLDTNGSDLVTVSNANLDLAPHGTGVVNVASADLLVGENAQITGAVLELGDDAITDNVVLERIESATLRKLRISQGGTDCTGLCNNADRVDLGLNIEPAYGFHIFGQHNADVHMFFQTQDGDVNENQQIRWGLKHYLAADDTPVNLQFGQTTASANILQWGYGSSVMYAPTHVYFGAGDTTTSLSNGADVLKFYLDKNDIRFGDAVIRYGDDADGGTNYQSLNYKSDGRIWVEGATGVVSTPGNNPGTGDQYLIEDCATIAVNPPSIALGAEGSVTGLTMTGVDAGVAACTASPSGNPWTGLILKHCEVTAANTVACYFNNVNASDPYDGASNNVDICCRSF